MRLTGFTSGAHGEVGAAVKKLLRQGADGVVLDLRDNGGGLLNEAVLVSSIFIPEGKIVSTKGRNAARARLRRGRRRDRHARSRSSCSSTATRRRRARSSPARCRTASARRWSARARSARASSRRSSSSPTAARSTSRSASTSCPAGATSAAAGVKKGDGHLARRQGRQDNPKTKPDEALRRAVKIVAAEVSEPRARLRGPVVAVLERRGPLPDRGAVLRPRGRRMNVDKSRSGARRRPGAGRAQLAAGGPRQGRAPASGARTWRAT